MFQTYNPPMIHVRIQEVAKARGITTAYQLQKAMNVNPGMAARLWKGKFEMIGLRTLDSLCAALSCEPGEILVRSGNGKGKGR